MYRSNGQTLPPALLFIQITGVTVLAGMDHDIPRSDPKVAAVTGLSLACVVYQCCAKPILDEQDFKIKKARMEAKKAMSKKK
ncbi:hypothetical protein AK812_SmicGene18506 [Symbiodinium microadriaticum]|uniref:Uncharacterized protein n=1 Tax=Symbiodinium microadriaticum TaxID=2951 RepID=A0A1Q9DUY4_SYMMI|nr:hypothetical protein AK812_SmicGene18506 [Symbiodinium microadriaticum]